MPKPFFARYARWVLVAFAIITPFLLFGAWKAVKSNTNKVEDWLPASFAETHELAWFRKHFVGDQFVVVSWDGCRLGGDPILADSEPDDPRLEAFVALIVPDADKPATRYARYFKTATTGRRMLDQLTCAPLNVPYAEAVQRLSGTMIGPDGRQTCVLITLSDQAVANFRSVLGRGHRGPLGVQHPGGVLFDALQEAGILADDVRLGGPPVDNVAIDQEAEKTLLRLVGFSGLLGLGLAWWSFRSIKLTLIVFACGLLSGAAAMATVWYAGATMDAVLMSMPAVVYISGISGAIHVINYYHDAVAESKSIDPFLGAPEKAIQHGWLPCFLCSLTTAIGFISLCTSNLVPIRKFGLFSGIGVMLTLCLLFSYLPAVMQLMPTRRRERRSAAPQLQAHRLGVEAIQPGFTWSQIARGLLRRNGRVVIACSFVMLFMALGLPRIKTSVEIMKLFHPRARIIADYTWLEQHLGNLVPMEVIVKVAPAATTDYESAARDPRHAYFDPAGYYRLNFAERLELIERIQRHIELLPEVDQAMSAATFAPAEPKIQVSGLGRSLIRPDMQYRIVRKQMDTHLRENRAELLGSGYLGDDSDGVELWRLTARVEALSGVDYAHFVSDIREQVQEVLCVYILRDEIARRFHQAGQQLSGSRVCVAGVTSERDGQIVRDDLAFVLLDLLRAAGAQIAYYDDHLPDLGTERPDQLPRLKRLDESDEVFRQQDCVVLFNASADDLIMPARLDNQDIKLVDRSEFSLRFKASINDVSALGPKSALAESSPSSANPISVVYTGVVPVVYKAERTLLNSLFRSVGWAFVTISIVMMLQLRNVGGGLLSMLPNLFPIVIVFGAMGWIGVVVDIGTVMAASVGLGIAVDDTIHFLTWFRRGMAEGKSHEESTMFAYEKCARAMLQTSVIGGLGLAVFALSTFTPTQRFGYMMLTLLAAAFVGDILFLPSLLTGPLGRTFRQRARSAPAVNSMPPERPTLMQHPHRPRSVVNR